MTAVRAPTAVPEERKYCTKSGNMAVTSEEMPMEPIVTASDKPMTMPFRESIRCCLTTLKPLIMRIWQMIRNTPLITAPGMHARTAMTLGHNPRTMSRPPHTPMTWRLPILVMLITPAFEE